ncbi:MAG: hypothetical protein EAZ85_09165 [Bacteroidetes bacterium]|nr:MAG: hypothetical protein EAZ85_09165 [Bacteroidota bacterium]TAG86989.1 MAG: hypothetical protein EAZ20_11590 [Bacteroidota bacterium]
MINKITNQDFISFIHILSKNIMFEAIITIVPGLIDNEESALWEAEKKEGKYYFNGKIDGDKLLETYLMQVLQKVQNIAIVLRCSTHQKYLNKRPIYEIWGYRLAIAEDIIYWENIDSEDLYQAFSFDSHTGQSIQPEEEVVYCGDDGKVCGWDRV